MERPDPRGGPKHAVFVDDTGRRARRAQRLYRTVAMLCLGALVLFVVSLLNGVPLPGLTRPVPLPSNEPAHARTDAAAPPVVAAGRNAAHPSPVAVIRSRTGVGAGTASGSALHGPTNTATRTPARGPAGGTLSPAAGSTGGVTSPRHTTPAPAVSPGRRTTPAPASSPGSPGTGRRTTPAPASSAPTGRHTTPPSGRQTTPAGGRHTTPASVPSTHPGTGRHTTPPAPSARPTAPRLL